MQFIRSLLFSLIMILATFFYSFFCVLAIPLPYGFRYRMIASWTGFIVLTAKWICGIRYRVEGLENIPDDAAIIFSKHQSTWETFFLPTLFDHLTIILKKELLKIPFFGWGLSIIDPIAIDRSDKRGAMGQILKQGSERLAMGRKVLFFPEGTRIAPGQAGQYKIGGARLAEKTGVCVIPVAHNAGKFWPRRGFIKKAGVIQVLIGPPIQAVNKDAATILAEAKRWIESSMQTMD
jgi:1-acyl-sn-glycerol-3-phosphate acyltransferase